MYPLHENLAAWAVWLAQDADGTWWCYEAEPNQHDTGWYENEVGRIAKVGPGVPNPDWRAALVKVGRDS